MTMAKAVAAAMQRASLALSRAAAGEVLDIAKLRSEIPAKATSTDVQPITFDQLINGWAAEKRPSEKTLYEWTRVMRQLAAFVGHDDARRLGCAAKRLGTRGSRRYAPSCSGQLTTIF